MNLLTLLQDILSALSSVMLYPVMILLVAFFVRVILAAGGFASEYLQRKKQVGRQYPKECIELLLNKDVRQLTSQETQEIPCYLQEYLKELRNELKEVTDKEMRIEYLLQSKEQKMAKSLDTLRLLVRAGPTLGLMGTIIPMGPALSGLSQGDIEKLSSNIIIAFTTTVVGLAIGIIAYFLSMIKNRWIYEDIKNLEYFTECIMKNEIP
ncbi:MAG: MotA/TolQ/ExbB proton channel family protein [Planctomycetota bacterium]